jgi:hypothetical protein
MFEPARLARFSSQMITMAAMRTRIVLVIAAGRIHGLPVHAGGLASSFLNVDKLKTC